MNITRPYNINLLIEDSLQQQIHYNGNVFANKCCHCNEGSLYMYFLSRICTVLIVPANSEGIDTQLYITRVSKENSFLFMYFSTKSILDTFYNCLI